MVYRGGALTSVLHFIQLYSEAIHSDVLQAGTHLVKTLCAHCEPSDPCIDAWIESLSALLDENTRQSVVVDAALQALASIVHRFVRAGQDPTPVATAELIQRLSQHLHAATSMWGGGGSNVGSTATNMENISGDVGLSFNSFASNLGTLASLSCMSPSSF